MCCSAVLRDLVRSGEAGRLRVHARISQETMAAGLGISRAMVCAIECGRQPCPWERAPGYLRVLRGLARHEAVTRELRGEQDAA